MQCPRGVPCGVRSSLRHPSHGRMWWTMRNRSKRLWLPCLCQRHDAERRRHPHRPRAPCTRRLGPTAMRRGHVSGAASLLGAGASTATTALSATTIIRSPKAAGRLRRARPPKPCSEAETNPQSNTVPPTKRFPLYPGLLCKCRRAHLQPLNQAHHFPNPCSVDSCRRVPMGSTSPCLEGSTCRTWLKWSWPCRECRPRSLPTRHSRSSS